MSNEYKIGTLADILELEDDQIDRLCAELPSHLKQIKALTELLNVVGEINGVNSVAEAVSPMTWIDDGKSNMTAVVECEGSEVVTFRKTSESKDTH